METKRAPAIRHLAGQDPHPVIEVFFEFQQLKSLFRQGWLRVGITKEHGETVAEHTLGVALLALFLADAHFPRLDRDKLLRMGLLHDFGEIYAGDIVPGQMPPEEKHALERRSVERVFSNLPRGAEYLAIWEEYEAGQTAEARFMREVDRLEMALQASVYEHELRADLSVFFDSADQALSTPELRRVLEQVMALRATGKSVMELPPGQVKPTTGP